MHFDNYAFLRDDRRANPNTKETIANPNKATPTEGSGTAVI